MTLAQSEHRDRGGTLLSGLELGRALRRRRRGEHLTDEQHFQLSMTSEQSHRGLIALADHHDERDDQSRRQAERDVERFGANRVAAFYWATGQMEEMRAIGIRFPHKHHRQSCGRAPRVSRNARTRGSRRATRSSTSSSSDPPPDESDPPGALAASHRGVLS